jgi:hypothetical protein
MLECHQNSIQFECLNQVQGIDMLLGSREVILAVCECGGE